MRPLPLLLALLLGCAALGASPARAITPAYPGCNLRWDRCYGDAGAINRSFACDTNAGTSALVGSFVPPADVVDANGLEITVDLASASTDLPAWWQMRIAGTCRQTSLSVALVPPEGSATCLDWYTGLVAGGIADYRMGHGGRNTVRIVAAVGVSLEALADLTGGTEYFGFQFVLNHARTVGDGACAGCETPVCLVVNTYKVVTPVSANNVRLQGPANGTDSDYATWRGGGVPVTWRGTGCPAATPARRSTWGSVKSLYR